MTEYFGHYDRPLICLHGGAGTQDPTREQGGKALTTLTEVAQAGMEKLKQGEGGREVATFCLRLLEDDPQFNAGMGSALQADGAARLSAALMDGEEQRFSGVIAAQFLRNPSLLVQALQERRARTLTGIGVELLARQLNLPVQGVLTESRVKRWLTYLSREGFEPVWSYDTVGVIVRDASRGLVAAASTGGRGFEFPGRVSDTPTVAGTYASLHAAVCATGYGEQIVDDGVAARLETRVRDGLTLEEACRRGMREAQARHREYGWIALSAEHWAACYTTSYMPFVVMGAEGVVGGS